MEIYIKNMVCVRCKMIVKKILEDLQLEYTNVELGVVELKESITIPQKDSLRIKLRIWGLFLLEDTKDMLVEKIKHSIIDMIRNNSTSSGSLKTSHYLSGNLSYNYTYLANLFSQETGICLRDFIIAHKIEVVKEMLINEGLTITEIAWKLNYSSVAHLSNQFNKVTGFRPSQFKKITGEVLIPLDQIGMLEAV